MTGGGSGVPYLGMDDADLEPGRQVGEYVVEEKIGEGGFGTVFRAQHPLIGKIVAIKVLARQYSAQPEMVSRFVSEARAVNQIRHRSIIDIFSFGQLEDGRHYYVMELLNGEPMDEYLEGRGRLSLRDAVPVLRSLARALDAAHSKGIAHRDLKPENVFLVVEDDGTIFPKLLDFGIAKLMGTDAPKEHKTRTGAPMGTPAYMSPEQCRGRDVDHRTDIYAFGILTYQLLTGVVPFEGEDYMDVLLKQIGEEPVRPSTRCPKLPVSVDEGILWMLSKDPAGRPPNLVTAVRTLEDAAIAGGISLPAGPAPTGAYAAPTGQPMSAQRTPSQATALPIASLPIASLPTASLPTSERPTAAIGTAETMGARGMSEEVASVQGPSGKTAARVAVAVAVAVVAGVAAYLAIHRGADTESGEAKPVAGSNVEAPVLPVPQRPTIESDAAPALSAMVILEISGAPEGTEVYGPRGLLGVAPGKIQLPRGDVPVLLTFKCDGHKTKTSEVIPNDDGTFEIALKSKRRGGKRKGGKGGKGGKDKKGGRDAIEDPFK